MRLLLLLLLLSLIFILSGWASGLALPVETQAKTVELRFHEWEDSVGVLGREFSDKVCARDDRRVRATGFMVPVPQGGLRVFRAHGHATPLRPPALWLEMVILPATGGLLCLVQG